MFLVDPFMDNNNNDKDNAQRYTALVPPFRWGSHAAADYPPARIQRWYDLNHYGDDAHDYDPRRYQFGRRRTPAHDPVNDWPETRTAAAAPGDDTPYDAATATAPFFPAEDDWDDRPSWSPPPGQRHPLPQRPRGPFDWIEPAPLSADRAVVRGSPIRVWVPTPPLSEDGIPTWAEIAASPPRTATRPFGAAGDAHPVVTALEGRLADRPVPAPHRNEITGRPVRTWTTVYAESAERGRCSRRRRRTDEWHDDEWRHLHWIEDVIADWMRTYEAGLDVEDDDDDDDDDAVNQEQDVDAPVDVACRTRLSPSTALDAAACVVALVHDLAAGVLAVLVQVTVLCLDGAVPNNDSPAVGRRR